MRGSASPCLNLAGTKIGTVVVTIGSDIYIVVQTCHWLILERSFSSVTKGNHGGATSHHLPPPCGNIRALATISRTLVLPALWSPTITTCKCHCVCVCASVVSK